MDPRLRDIVDALSTDAQSGASEMLNAVINALMAIPDHEVRDIPPGEWEEFALRLHLAKPAVAPVFNVANTILLEMENGGQEALRPALMEMLEQERRSGVRIAEAAVRHVRGRWLVTSSYSSSVSQALRALAKARPLRVTVAESLPGGEGRLFARSLSEAGIETEVIHDSTVFARMAEADGAITGADSLTPDGLVNKVGTRPLAEAARASDRPAYAVCGWSKACPVVLTDLTVTRKEVGLRLSEHVQVFESTPLDLFTSLITDRGPMTPRDLRMELGVSKVAAAWSAHGLFRRA
jgi:translation initiation factor eIF-2B subunit delta